MKLAILSAAAVLVALLTFALADEPRPELGRVDWGRDFDQALARSAESGKPVLVLFQEVPG